MEKDIEVELRHVKVENEIYISLQDYINIWVDIMSKPNTLIAITPEMLVNSLRKYQEDNE